MPPIRLEVCEKTPHQPGVVSLAERLLFVDGSFRGCLQGLYLQCSGQGSPKIPGEPVAFQPSV
jgi:hypothetical protein